MNGGKTTLNGRLAAFLYGASPERAKPLIELGLTGAVERIVFLRGHASNIGLVVDREELSELRQTVFEIVKAGMR